jgi:hypothetical protein
VALACTLTSLLSSCTLTSLLSWSSSSAAFSHGGDGGGGGVSMRTCPTVTTDGALVVTLSNRCAFTWHTGFRAWLRVTGFCVRAVDGAAVAVGRRRRWRRWRR